MEYIFRAADEQALKSLLARRNGGARVLLITGAPGVGKTAFSEAIARRLGASYVYALLHSWSDDQELFCGIDVAAAVAGEAESVRQPGVLAVAAEKTRQGLTVLCLDEIDKVQERTEYLLLDFLQSGRVPVRPGVHIQADLRSLLVILTSNGTRPLSDALRRRCRRLEMAPLSAETIEAIMAERSGAAKGVCRLARKLAYSLGERAGRPPSLQELCLLMEELLICSSVEEAERAFAGWCDATPARADIAPVWGELQVARRQGNV